MLPKVRYFQCFLVLVVMAVSACSESGTSNKATLNEDVESADTAPPAPLCALTMGLDPWEPYQYQDIGNEVRGLDIDIVTRLAQGANCTLEFANGDWLTLFGMLKDGTVDFMTGATKTKRREEVAIFSDPYREESFVLYVREDELPQYKSKTLQQLLDGSFRLGTTSGYIYGDHIVALQDNPKYEDFFQSVAIGETNFAKLADMQIDGFLEDPFVANTIIRKKGLHNISATETEVGRGSVHLMFSTSSVDLAVVERFNKALAELRVSGEYQKILDRYRN